MEFHSDRLNKKKQKLVPMRKGVHKEYKDNEKRDFDEEEGWSEELTCETNALCQENSRLKNSISDCFDYMNMKGVLK